MKRAEPGKKTPVVVIAGPTASGKSALALALAEALGGTVINADAMQVYRELSILTARPMPEETARVPHRLYGVTSVRRRGTVALWRKMAIAAIETARNKGRLPIVVGGTGLYLKALTDGLAPIPDISQEVRDVGQALLKQVGAAGLHEELKRLDPKMAERLKPGDSQRIARAWEVITATGRSLSLFQRIAPAKVPYHFEKIVILPPRQGLYQAIDRRCLAMVAGGALDEVRNLLDLKLDPELPAMKAVGVRELGAYLSGERKKADSIEKFQQVTRNYAKRQTTWFRHQMPDALTIAEQYSERLAQEIFSFIRKTVDESESRG